MPTGFDLASGEFSEDFTGAIVDLVFTPGEFGVQSVVTIERDTPITGRDGTLYNEKTIYVKIPDGWQVEGDTIVHPDTTKKITKKAQWGAWVESAISGDPSPKDAILAAGGGAYCTKGWAGHRFHFMTVGQNPYTMPVDADSLGWMTKKVEAGDGWCEREGVRATGIQIGDTFHGVGKGYIAPVEYLGTKDAPVSGEVGASAPAGFDISALPDDVVDTWRPLAETMDDKEFMQAVMSGGLLSADKLGAAYGPTTAALGNGELATALRPF